MNFFYRILLFLQRKMNTPTTFGWFHLLCILLSIIVLVFLYKKRSNYSERQLKTLLFNYGIISFVLELLKQLIWSFNYDSITGLVTWDYNWYAFPFQLCSTPIYVALMCSFMKNSKVRNALLSYLAFFTMLGGIATVIYPESCFTGDILINIHTMWLHCGSLVVSIYLLFTRAVEIKLENLKHAFLVFLIFVIWAEGLNVFMYNSGILNGETFNMFYISPYFVSSLPVFDLIQENVPFVFYIKIYIITLFLGALIIYSISSILKTKKIFLKG